MFFVHLMLSLIIVTQLQPRDSKSCFLHNFGKSFYLKIYRCLSINLGLTVLAALRRSIRRKLQTGNMRQKQVKVFLVELKTPPEFV